MLLRQRRLLHVLPRQVSAFVQSPKVTTWAVILIVALGPLLAFATYAVLGGVAQEVRPDVVRGVLLADLVYTLTVAALIASRVSALVAARRRKLPGSKLHRRLTTVFAMMALAPTIIVAIFAAVTINFGVEGWFSDRVRSVVVNSLDAAQAYENEHRINLSADAQVFAGFLNRNKQQFPLLSAGELRELLTAGQQQMRREVSEAFIIDGAGELRVRGALSYLFDYERPSAGQLAAASTTGAPIIIEDWENNEFRALVHLSAFADRYLYVTRDVDGGILNLLDDTQNTVALYLQLEGEREQLLFELALIYLVFAIIVIFGAVWLAFWLADRLSRPVVRLAGAAERIGAGDLGVRVREDDGGDEISTLSRVFNRMTTQVKRQQDALIIARNESDRRRRVFEAVLTGVSAGVIGVNEEGLVEVCNDAATELLARREEEIRGLHVTEAFPEFATLFERLEQSEKSEVQEQLNVTTANREEELLVRISRHPEDAAAFGYVITFDAITDLVSAQRMAAWGDVARRIAHEIKNPLTPIQLSAERMKRKYATQIDEGRDGFEKIADVIVRQTNDLRRIVDEFSRFARLPEPQKQPVDLIMLLNDTILLQRDAAPEVDVRLDAPDTMTVTADAGLIGQALTNLIKNAAEAVTARVLAHETDTRPPEVVITPIKHADTIEIRIEDSGTGLPANAANRLFEPYVTHREGGTGLGLAIVKKIIEDHGGTLRLENRLEGGARAVIVMPATTAPQPSHPTEPALNA
ncbi:MAG: PAS domain-containing sensor histidine kinase [Pseudomonadota bacterium]